MKRNECLHLFESILNELKNEIFQKIAGHLQKKWSKPKRNMFVAADRTVQSSLATVGPVSDSYLIVNRPICKHIWMFVLILFFHFSWQQCLLFPAWKMIFMIFYILASGMPDLSSLTFSFAISYILQNDTLNDRHTLCFVNNTHWRSHNDSLCAL